MKPLTLAVHSLSAASLLALGAACTSDTNPFDVNTTSPSTSEKTATIRLEFNVAETRAGLTTSDEEKLTYVNIYVFDEDGKLEGSKMEHYLPTDGNQPELEVSTGTKTVYAIAGNSLKIPMDGITTREAFEDLVFYSPLGSLKNNQGYMMIGKSDTKSVYRTVKGAAVPATNVFTINLERLVAKTQVKLSDKIDYSSFGFKKGISQFTVAQLCNKMRVLPNGIDVIDPYVDANNGSFDGYTAKPEFTENFVSITSGDFTAEGCRYLTENIVLNPTSGNTTFVVLNILLTPLNFYDYNNGEVSLSATRPTGTQFGQTFYAVAIIDQANGIEDFVINPSNKHVYTFNQIDAANRYAAALNGEEAAAMTVSEADTPMRAPGTRANTNFQVVTFEQGAAYYRINIKDGDEYKVERNKYYKITVNSIKSLGCHSEDLLRPTNPNTALDSKPTGTAMIGATFKVKDWDEVDQGVNIE